MNLDLKLACALVTAHLLADFVFQSDQDVANERKTAVLAKRALLAAGLSYLLVGDGRAWFVPVVIGLAHALMARIKISWKHNGTGLFLADQVAHLSVIMGAAWLSPKFCPVASLWLNLWGVAFLKILGMASGLILTTHVGGVLVGIWVQPYLGDMTKQKPEGGKPILAAGNESQRGLAKGGRSIGRWERGLIFFLVMIGKPEAVAFLVAAKSIFRFGELNNRENRAEAEYITIGTLMSFTWGLVVSWLTWRGLSLMP